MGISGGVPPVGSKIEDAFRCDACFGLGYQLEKGKMVDCSYCHGTGRLNASPVITVAPTSQFEPSAKRKL